MLFDFGTVQDYNDKGFGFINRTFESSRYSRRKVFFHISKVKRKYPEIAQKLDNGLYSGINFWYEIETTHKGEQVNQLWLTPQEIPSQQRDEIVTYLEKLWRDIQKSIPHWLDEVTLELVGETSRNQLHQEREQAIHQYQEAEREKQRKIEEERRKKEAERLAQLRAAREAEAKRKRELEEEFRKREQERLTKLRIAQEAKEMQRKVELQSRAPEIKQICTERGIETLIHFTRIGNLSNILREGLLARDILEARPYNQQPDYNDSQRIDGYTEATCLSISFPNYQMFYKYSMNNRADWVILLLKPAVLWEIDCAFCQENAASNSVRFQPITERKTPDALRGMFVDFHNINRRSLNIPVNYPTHPQAEILAFDPIPPEYILAVHFYDLPAFERWYSFNPQVNYSQKFYYGEHYFAPRSDWAIWKSTNVNNFSGLQGIDIFAEGELPF